MVVQTRGARLVESIHNTFQVLNQRGVVEVFFHPTTQVIRTSSNGGSVRIVAFLFTETTTVEGTEDGNAGMDDNNTALNRAKLVVVRFQFGRNAADTSMRRFTAYTPWAPDWHYKLQPHYKNLAVKENFVAFLGHNDRYIQLFHIDDNGLVPLMNGGEDQHVSERDQAHLHWIHQGVIEANELVDQCDNPDNINPRSPRIEPWIGSKFDSFTLTTCVKSWIDIFTWYQPDDVEWSEDATYEEIQEDLDNSSQLTDALEYCRDYETFEHWTGL